MEHISVEKATQSELGGNNRNTWCEDTYDVRRRFESAALRSFTCAFCVARNWILSWSLSVYNLRSA